MPVPVNSVSDTVISAGGTSLPTDVIAFADTDVQVERQQVDETFAVMANPAEYTVTISPVNQKVTINLVEATTDITYRVSNIAALAQLSDYTLADYSPARLTRDLDKIYLQLQRLALGAGGDDSASGTGGGSASGTGWGSDFDLPQDGTDIAPALTTLMEERQLAGIRTTRYVPRQGEPDPYINSFLKVPAGHTFDRSQVTFRRGKLARIGMSGGQVELPEEGKYRLVNAVAAGATTIYLRVPTGGSITALQDAATAGMDLVIRGQNDASGNALERETIPFSIVDGSNDQNIEILLGRPLENAYEVVYADSDWEPNGPASDYSLISVTVGGLVDVAVADGDIEIELVSVPEAMVAGSTVLLTSDELVPSGTGTNPFGREVHRVRSVDGTTVTLMEPVTRAFPLDQNPKLLLREPFEGATILCGHRNDTLTELSAPPENFATWLPVSGATINSSASFTVTGTGASGIISGPERELVVGRQYRVVWKDIIASTDDPIEIRNRASSGNTAGDAVVADVRGSGSVIFTATQARVYLRRSAAAASTTVTVGEIVFFEEPSSRIDAYTMQYVDDCTIVEPWVDDETTAYYLRGAGVMDREGYNNRVVDARIFRRPGALSGDQNGISHYYSTFSRDERSFVVGASTGVINQGGISPATYDYLAVDCNAGWDVHGCGCVGAILDGFEISGGTSLSSNSANQRGVVIGNTSHRSPDRRTTIRNGVIRGFNTTSGATGLTIWPATQHAVIENVRILDCTTGVNVSVDGRAGLLTIEGVRLDGLTVDGCDTGISARGRPADWAASEAITATTARPVWKTASGALWSTTVTDTTGTEEPDPGVDPVVDVTTSSDGEIIWTYRGLVGQQIDGLCVRAAVSGAVQTMALDSVDKLELIESSVEGTTGVALANAPAGLIRNVKARITADGDWLIDGGGNDATELDGISAGASAIDETGGSTFVISGGGGGGGTEIPAGTNALVGRDGAGAVALRTIEAASLEVVGAELRAKGVLSLGDVLLTTVTTARELAEADLASGATSRAGQLRVLPVNLSVAGTIDVPEDAPAGWVWHLIIDPSSEQATIGVTGDAGSVNGSAGGSVDLIAGTEVIVRVTANAGTAPTVRVIGAKGGKTIYGDLVAADQGSALPHGLSGFNVLVLNAAEKTVSFTFDATHAGKVVPANHATVAIVATIPTNSAVPFPIGTVLAVEQTGAAAVSIVADSGVTAPSLTGRTNVAAGQGSPIGVRKTATNTWSRSGDYAAS